MNCGNAPTNAACLFSIDAELSITNKKSTASQPSCGVPSLPPMVALSPSPTSNEGESLLVAAPSPASPSLPDASATVVAGIPPLASSASRIPSVVQLATSAARHDHHLRGARILRPPFPVTGVPRAAILVLGWNSVLG